MWIFFFFLCCSISVAQAASIDDLTFSINNGEATITNCNTNASGVLDIPATYSGYPVTTIADEVFTFCSNLTSVTIPSSITFIGDETFALCTSLTEIVVPKANPEYASPDGVLYSKDISVLCVYPAGKVGAYEIPSSVTSIKAAAFDSCSGLTSLTISDGVTSIGGYTFQSCSGLTRITIPKGVTSIGNYAFDGCSSLSSIRLQPMVAPTIESGAFDQISSTAVIYYPLGAAGYAASYDGVPTEEAAAPTFGLYTYEINPDNVSVTITDYPETATGAIEIPATIDGRSVTSIGEQAFSYCRSLTSVIIPDSVTSIGDFAFGVCTGLTSITIGNSVISIGPSAFYGCTGLTSINIPDSVTSIGYYAFESCTSLTSITIPNSVSIILDGAFYGCTNLASILLEPMAAPTIGTDAFASISSAAIIQYPQGATGYAASYDGVPTQEEAAPPSDPEFPVIDIDDFYESSAGVSVVVSAIPTAGYPTNFSYQWHFNNFAIPANFGGTAASYTIDGIPSNDGTWRVVVTNDAGSTEASFEYRVFADSDSDGLSDYRESNITNTNPSLADTDGDGLTDGDEVNTHNSSPIDSDSDDDTILDGIEVRHAAFGFDPAVESSAALTAFIAAAAELPGVSTDAQNNSLSLGGISLTPSGGNSLSVDFIIEESEDLSSWTTVDTVSHSLDTSDTKKFIRVRKP